MLEKHIPITSTNKTDDAPYSTMVSNKTNKTQTIAGGKGPSKWYKSCLLKNQH